MSNERTRTSLLSLPDELLDKIVHEVFAPFTVSFEFSKEARDVALICRRFRSLVEQRAYQRFTYGGDRKLLRWRLNKFENRPDLRALVRHLEFRRVHDEDDAIDDDDENFDIKTASFPGSHSALSRFPEVRTLVLDEAFPADIANVLGGPASEAHLSVRRLEINYMAHEGDEQHKAAWWNALSRFPNLEELLLAPVAGEEFTVLAFDTSEAVMPVLPVRTLEVTTRVNLADGSPHIITLFPNLNDLRVDIAGTSLDTSRVGRLLHMDPKTLETLHLYGHSYSETVVPSLESHLERFTQLQRLRLDRIASLDAILPALQSSSISVLELASDVSDKFLLGLVGGPTRMKRLQSLRLNHLWPIPRAETIRYGTTSVCRKKRGGASAIVQLKEYYASKLPHGATEKGLRKAVDIARSHGSKVSSSALGYIGWEELFDREVESCLVDVTLAEDDWTVIEEYLGKDEAAKAVQRRREQPHAKADGESAA
ncbi:hypothetical protein JCM10908_002388 [Rhodotorula pacifica]|uniref:uncharacterized protein n=1 Tax=Rhodotorula pacifica TaxID=1495444 RepID=UPI0031790E04